MPDLIVSRTLKAEISPNSSDIPRDEKQRGERNFPQVHLQAGWDSFVWRNIKDLK